MTDSGDYRFYYVLAAKGIQEFILRGDKLRLMVGGSELIEDLAGDFLSGLLDQFGLKADQDYRLLSRAAGGARLLFRDKQAAENLAKLLPLALSVYAPGLDAVQAVVEIKDGLAKTMDAAEKALQQRRNLLLPIYPVPGPLVARCPRSGLPAVGWFCQAEDRELADSSMLAKVQARKGAKAGLSARVLPPEARNAEGNALRPLPDNFEELVAEGSSIAIVHIDGNGLGGLVMKLLEELAERTDAEVADCYARFCLAVGDATTNALRTALRPIVEATNRDSTCAVYPFRPLVCAGDDVTIVLRAADAMGFVQRFLTAFETCSGEELAKVGIASLNHSSLTACAGIAYVKKSFPFAQAYELCESLCRYAKDKTGRTCSAVAFWRLTSAVAHDVQEIVRTELTTSDESRLTMMPYTIGSKTSTAAHPTLNALAALTDAVDGMPRGSLRGLLTDLYQGRERAQRGFERICDVATGRGGEGDDRNHLAALQNALRTITGGTGGGVLFDSHHATPLHDAIELLAAESK